MPEKKLKLNAKEKKFMKTLFIFDAKPVPVTNPFTKETVILEPIAVALYDFIKGAEALRKNFSTALHIFMANWPAEYFKLLD